MMNKQTTLNSFLKNPPQNYKRNEPSVDTNDMNSQNMSREEENEEFQKRQYIYFLPNDIAFWPKIEDKLKSIKEKRYQFQQIVNAIEFNINIHYSQKKNINVDILTQYFDNLSHNSQQYYQNELLPFMANMALQITQVFENDPIILLLKGEEKEQKFTKQQIAVLLCNMFFCTLHTQPCSETFPKIFDFSMIYMKTTVDEFNILRTEKLKFLFNYFKMIQQNKINLDLCVSFERVNFSYGKSVKSHQIGGENNNKIDDMCEVFVFDEKSIESGQNQLQVTFANKFIGGGVLHKGAIQEEIRYLISPECLIGILLFEELEKSEAIIIQGAQQVSDQKYSQKISFPFQFDFLNWAGFLYFLTHKFIVNHQTQRKFQNHQNIKYKTNRNFHIQEYQGYGKTLKFIREYHDDKLSIQESNNCLNVTIVGIDAINFNDNPQDKQFSIVSMCREIVKAYAGFNGSKKSPINKSIKGIITGNWGCGDFGGDKELKFILQWIAASWAERGPLYYCTFGDNILKLKIEEALFSLERYHLEQIVNILKQFMPQKKKYPDLSVFDYIATFVN